MVSDREWWAWQGIPTDRCEDPGWDELATALPPEVAALLAAARPQTWPLDGDGNDSLDMGHRSDSRDLSHGADPDDRSDSAHSGDRSDAADSGDRSDSRDGAGRTGDDRDEDDTERWPGPGDPCAGGPTHWAASSTYAACTPRFLAPTLPRSRPRRVRRHATRAR